MILIACTLGFLGHINLSETIYPLLLISLSCVFMGINGLIFAFHVSNSSYSKSQLVSFSNNIVFVISLCSLAFFHFGNALIVLSLSFFIAAVISCFYSINTSSFLLSISGKPQVIPGFRHALIFSCLESAGFTATQLVVLYCAARSGVGVTSAAALAQRIVMSALGLIVLPLSNILMMEYRNRRPKSSKFLILVISATTIILTGIGIVLSLASKYALNFTHLAGKFSGRNAEMFADLVPAFSIWLLAMGLSAILGKLAFSMGVGRKYSIQTLFGYGVAVVLRLVALVCHMDFKFIIVTGASVELITVIYVAIFLITTENRSILKNVE